MDSTHVCDGHAAELDASPGARTVDIDRRISVDRTRFCGRDVLAADSALMLSRALSLLDMPMARVAEAADVSDQLCSRWLTDPRLRPTPLWAALAVPAVAVTIGPLVAAHGQARLALPARSEAQQAAVLREAVARLGAAVSCGRDIDDAAYAARVALSDFETIRARRLGR